MIKHERAIRRVPAIAAVVVAAVALLVLAGWIFNIEVLKSLLHPERVAMNPMSAVAFLLCALALWIVREGYDPFTRACAAAIIFIGAARLTAYASGWPVNIDQMLFTSRLGANVMAPNTAVCFVLVGMALLLLEMKVGRVYTAQLLLLAAVCIALLSLTGYLYRSTSLYRVRSFIPMALPTAITFMILCVGILIARPQREPVTTIMSDTIGGTLARRLIPAAIALPLLGGYFRLLGQHRGLFDLEFGTSLLVLAIIFIFNLLIWWCARVILRIDLRRRRAEAEMREQHQLLEKTHGELKSAQSALVQSEKLAGLGQMVAGVAHEINNPLSFVANNVSVLRRDVGAFCELLKLYGQADPLIAEHRADIAAELRELGERIDLDYTTRSVEGVLDRSREGLRRIQQIVKDLRDFARLDESDLHEVDINAGVESTINIIRGRAKKKQVTIEFAPANLPPCACYPAKINQVVMNLIANGIDACPEGGRINVATIRDKGNIKIEVSDTGPGVAPAIRGRIFDPFFTTKPMGEGTGLGLSISYGIIRDHGGWIDVDGAVGGGAKFTVILPDRPRGASKSA